MSIRAYIVGKRFTKAFLSSIVASGVVLAGTSEYWRIFIIAILTAIIQAIEKYIKETTKETKE